MKREHFLLGCVFAAGIGFAQLGVGLTSAGCIFGGGCPTIKPPPFATYTVTDAFDERLLGATVALEQDPQDEDGRILVVRFSLDGEETEASYEWPTSL